MVFFVSFCVDGGEGEEGTEGKGCIFPFHVGFGMGSTKLDGVHDAEEDGSREEEEKDKPPA